MNRRVVKGIVTLGTAAAILATAALPAMAQAKGSADANAAKRVNPHWKAPRNAWGQPDLEGIWTTDDMRGIPMSRPAQSRPLHGEAPASCPSRTCTSR